MKSSFFRGTIQLAVFAAITNAAWGRSWVDVVDTTVYVATMDDPYRQQFKVELDPLTYDAENQASPTIAPTASPVLNIGQAPTVLPTLSPTASPTQSVHKCTNDNEVLHLVRMHDTWGDGWGNSSITIYKVNHTAVSNITTTYGIHSTMYSRHTNLRHTSADVVVEASLQNGEDGYVYVCLEAGTCYDVQVGDSLWSNEIKWDIREASSTNGEAGQTLAKGLAPESCQFSVQDKSTGAYICPLVCSSDEADSSPTKSQSSVEPTPVPSVSPTIDIPTVKIPDQTASPTKNSNSTSFAPTESDNSTSTNSATNSTSPTVQSNSTDSSPSVVAGTEAPVLGIQGTPTASPRPVTTKDPLSIQTQPPTTPPSKITTAPPTVAETASATPAGGWTYGPTTTWYPTGSFWPTATYWPTATSYPTYSGDDDGYYGDDDRYYNPIVSEAIDAASVQENAKTKVTAETQTVSPSLSPLSEASSTPTPEATRTVELGYELVPTLSPTGGDARLTESPTLVSAEAGYEVVPTEQPTGGDAKITHSDAPSSTPSISAEPSDTPSTSPSNAYRGARLTENPSGNPSQGPSTSDQPSDTPSSNPSVAYRGVRLTETPTNDYIGVKLTEQSSRYPSMAPSLREMPSDAPSDAPEASPSTESSIFPSSFPSRDTLSPALPTFLGQLLQVVPEERLTTGNRAPSSVPSSEPTPIQPQDREKIRKDYLDMLINGPQR